MLRHEISSRSFGFRSLVGSNNHRRRDHGVNYCAYRSACDGPYAHSWGWSAGLWRCCRDPDPFRPGQYPQTRAAWPDDSLSLLPNRRALHHDVHRKAPGGGEFALALIDLDGFKQVNDHYGHFVGDRLIKDCGVLLRDVCGEEGRVYRLGGDEFAILSIGAISGLILEGICRNLLIKLTKPFQIDDRSIVVGASIGLARSTGKDGLSSSELLRRTDVAMYASKRAGKARCTWFSEEFDRNRERTRKLDGELRHALAENEFRVHYQPLVDANTKAVVAVEALLRWERPDGIKIGPDVFIPVAEESGLINAIGLWVLHQACTDALCWAEIKLSVNVSAAQLRNPEFPIELGQLLEQTGFPASRLELEVTETHLVFDSDVANRSLEVIRNFGVRIVLDDFGTGYASIGFLRKFRFEKLKIDRSLVVDAAVDRGSRGDDAGKHCGRPFAGHGRHRRRRGDPGAG